PEWLFAAQDHDLTLRLKIEVAGSAPVIVAGTSFISGISFDPEIDSVHLAVVTKQGRSDVGVTMRADAAADAESGERWADQTHASWWARLDVDRAESFALVVTLTSGGVERTSEIIVPAQSLPIGVAARATGGSGVELTADVGLAVAA